MTKNANRKKFHYIYRTTCKVTGRYYIGMHSTDNLEDGYVGSGKRLWYSINKHGKENHVCEILEFLPDRPTLRAREAELVCEDKLTDPMCMNLKVGGEGGFEKINELGLNTGNRSGVEIRKKASETFKARIETDEEFRAARSALAAHASSVMRDKFQKEFGVTSNLDLLSEESKEKRRLSQKATFASNGHQVGEANSQFGKKWMSNDQESLKVLKSEVEYMMLRGYRIGRK